MVYLAVTTALLAKPGATANALIVSLAFTGIGPVYLLDEIVGVLPLVV